MQSVRWKWSIEVSCLSHYQCECRLLLRGGKSPEKLRQNREIGETQFYETSDANPNSQNTHTHIHIHSHSHTLTHIPIDNENITKQTKATNQTKHTVIFGQRAVAANCFGQLRWHFASPGAFKHHLHFHLNRKCRTHNSRALIIINQTIHSPIGHGKQKGWRKSSECQVKAKAMMAKQNNERGGTSEMPKRNSSNELPPQNAGGKNASYMYIYTYIRMFFFLRRRSWK